ncbi:hypothetical protein BC828DRAFT_394202 [Blastocladiella britannica]|nr:hypothetical protein BC828DRAFT_394202 [Blastocladiella britannica]
MDDNHDNDTGDRHDAKRTRLMSREKHNLLHGQAGAVKRTAFQRQRDDLLERERLEGEARAKVFSEFVESFDDGPADSAAHDKTFHRTGARAGDADRIFRPLAPAPSRQQEQYSYPSSAYQPEAPVTANPLRKRKLDDLLETFRQRREDRPLLGADPARRHSPTTALPSVLPPLLLPSTSEEQIHLPLSTLSTNIYVGNLSPVLDEETLCATFATFGPIASVKIMWPRTKEEQSRGHHSGFVCFMDRPCAQRAFQTLQGQSLLGFTLRMEWGKPVVLPDHPFHVSPEWLNQQQELQQQRQQEELQRHREHGLGALADDILVTVPDEPVVRLLIHQTVERVLKWGHAFEQHLVAQARGNIAWLFLTDTRHPDHHYYKWRCWSLANGDTTTKWRTRPLYMVADGPRWTPPPCLEADDVTMQALPDSDDDVAADVGLRTASVRLIRRIRALCNSPSMTSPNSRPPRALVARIMSLAMRASECAVDVAAELASLATRANGSPGWRMNMLLVIHDVATNAPTAAISGAWRYRDALMTELPRVFASLRETYLEMRGSDGDRWAAEGWRSDVLAIIAWWRAEMVFSREFCSEIEAALKAPVAAMSSSTGETTAGPSEPHTPIPDGSGGGELQQSEATASWMTASTMQPLVESTLPVAIRPPPSAALESGGSNTRIAFSLAKKATRS